VCVCFYFTKWNLNVADKGEKSAGVPGGGPRANGKCQVAYVKPGI
jgi:hypothetical protein